MLPMVQSEPVHFKCGILSVNTATSPPTTLPPSLTPESDVDELVDIFFDVDVAATTYPRNKCYNEKRRREQENETINQLEELLFTCLAEVKQPDKNGIVREATRQIQEVLQRRQECPGECPLRAGQSLSPVQAGEVSSTQPQPPCPGLHYTELTTLIEALKHYTGSLGWILLEINSKGEIECVTENIKDLILRDRTELYKKSIFSLLQVKDHAKLRPLLRSIQNFNWSAGDIDKFQAIQAGLIVKNSNGTDTSVVEAVIHAAPVRGSSSEEAGSVMCVIRRCEDASAALIPVCGGPPAISAGKHVADHIVFRLDCNFTILSCDLSGVENFINPSVSLVGTRYLELVCSGDRGRVALHLQEAACLPAPPAISEPFRLRLCADRAPIRVTARSRLWRAKPTSGEPDFIMSTHSVLDDSPAADAHADEPAGAFSMNDFDLDPWAASLLGDMADERKERKDVGEGSQRAPAAPAESPPQHHQNSQQQHSQQQHSQQQHPQQQHSQQQHPQQQHSQQQHPQQQHSQQQHPQQQHPQQQHSQQQHPQQQHPQQQHLQQQHPQHPQQQLPQQQQHSHQQQHSQQQHSQQQHSQQQHPQQQHSQQQHSQQQHSHQQHSQQQHSQQLEEPTRLRTILLSKPENRIILNNCMMRHEDEEAGGESSAPHTPHTPAGPHTPHTPAAAQSPVHARPPHALHAAHAPPPPPQHSHAGPVSQSHHNPLMRQMLKETTDDDAEERRSCNRSAPHPSALLSQLLQPTNNGPANNGRANDNAESSYIEKMTTKRKFDDAKGIAPNAKRATPENQQVSSSAAAAAATPTASTSPASSGGSMSPLCQKNQILVSLLAREQSTPTTPPQLSNPGVRPYPPRLRAPPPHHAPPHPPHPPHPPQPPRHHSALSDILTGNNHRMNVVNGGAGGAEPRGSHLQIMLQQGGAPAGRYPPPHYQPRYAQPQPQSSQHNANVRQNAGGGDCEVPSDKTLSDILDDVLATMPDSDRNMRQRQEDIEDRSAAVKAITASLMQCEKVTKHPAVSSPGTPPVYSVQSPGPCPMPSASQGYPSRPPPTIAEQHARLLQMQRTQQMLVSPEAAEQPQSDLGSTINALVTETPPNVTLLPRGDYHPGIYQTNQMGSNYGTIKITSPQQNPMLSRQLSVGGSGGYVHSSGAAHTAAALHTPMTPQPYHRAPRPHLVGGYYEDGAGDCGEYARCTPLPPHAPHAHAPHLPHPYRSPGQLPCPGNGSPGVAGGGAGGTSEYVRNELRAVVGARSARPDMHQLQPPDMDSLMSFDIAPPGGGSVVGGRAAATTSSWESQQSTPSTTEAGSAEAAAGGDEGAAGAGGGADGAPANSANAKASLLQKLLSQ